MIWKLTPASPKLEAGKNGEYGAWKTQLSHGKVRARDRMTAKNAQHIAWRRCRSWPSVSVSANIATTASGQRPR